VHLLKLRVSVTAHEISKFLGHVESVKILVANNADVNAKDDGEYSSLHLAVLNGNIEIAKVLLGAKCDVNHKNIDGFTALHSACGLKNIPLVKLLLENGADSSIKDAKGKSVAELLKKLGFTSAPPSSTAKSVTTPTTSEHDADKPKFPWEIQDSTETSSTASTNTSPAPGAPPNELQKEIEKVLGEQV